MKVLLVDDEAIIRKVLRVVLEAEGYDVHEAASAQDAIALAAAENPDVVVCDLMLPGTRGDEVCRRLKAASATVKVLVLTSMPTDEAADHALRAGADDVMAKPFSPLELLAKVQHLAGDG